MPTIGTVMQNIQLRAGALSYILELDGEGGPRRAFPLTIQGYNDALSYIIRYLASCQMEHGANQGVPLKKGEDK